MSTFDFSSFFRQMGIENPIITVTNHYVPLAGETYGGSTHEPLIEGGRMGHCVSMERAIHRPDDYRSPEVLRATQYALEAHACLPRDVPGAISLARQALQISPLCPEAYNVLALCSGSNEGALELYRQAEGMGLKVVPDDCLADALKNPDMWMRAPLRPYLRALFGVGNTLRKLGRHREALDIYERLCKQSSKMHTIGPFTNWFAHLPELWFRVHGPKECLARMAKATAVRELCVTYESSQLYWQYTMALCQFATGKVRGYKGCDGPDLDQEGAAWLNAWSGAAGALATRFMPLVVDYLTGDAPMPSNTIPRFMPGAASHTQAALYVKVCGDMWHATPGAVDWIRRTRNTQLTAEALWQAHSGEEPLDVDALLRHIEGGLFVEAATIPSPYYGCTILQSVCALPDASIGDGRSGAAGRVRLAKALLAQGADPRKRNVMGLNALVKACYYGAGPEVVTLLLGEGCDPMEGDEERPSAISMCANQGNPREMDAILTHSPQLLSTKAKGWRIAGMKIDARPLLEHLLYGTLESSCLPCVAGGSKCQRCQHKDKAHSPHCSFHGCVDVLVKHGLRESPRITSYIEHVIGMTPPSDRGRLRDVVQHFEQASRRAAQTASKAKTSSNSGKSSSSTATAAQGQRAASASSSTQPDASSSSSRAAAVKCCRECGTTDKRLQKCSGCRAVSYCGPECQLKDWPQHKADCKRVQKERKQKQVAA